MRIIPLAAVAAVLWCVAPALAVFDGGSAATFGNGLQGWSKSGDVVGTGGFAELGRKASNRDSKLYTYFVAPSDGQYTLSYDYKFAGVDKARRADDIVSAGIGKDATSYSEFGARSSTGLTGGAWRTATSQPVTLKAGQTYYVGFELNESRLGHRRLVTNLGIDNVSLTQIQTRTVPDIQSGSGPGSGSGAQIQAVPAPGAILLGSIGAGLVGWLRSRRAL